MNVERSKILYLLLVSTGVFLVSMIGLMLQIALTRMFSATIWYHYTFVAVSIALFGWGLGGIVLYFFKEKLKKRGLDLVAVSLIIFSFFIPIYLLIFRLIPAYPTSLPAYFLLSLVPFFLAGLCLALVYSRFTGSANKLYFADLVGASVACLLAEPVLWTLGAESTILLLGIMAAAPAILLSLFSRKRKMIALSLIALAILPAIAIVNLNTPFLNISNAPTKEMYKQLNGNPNLRVVLTRWNSFSRVDVVEGFGGRTLAGIYIDADASTEVVQWDGNISSLQYMNQSMDMLPYYFVERPNVLIIGPGGGKDILYALAGGSSKISAVELNPTIVEVVKNYGERAGNVYNNLSNVEVFVDEGRSFVSRSNGKFDVVTLTRVDSWAAISAGGYALADNYLYTKEAFAEYLNHLTDQGELTMIRWQPEIPRLVSTAVETFAQFGEDAKSAGKHVAIVLRELEPGRVVVLLILKKLPFTHVEAENLVERVAALGAQYSAYYIPYVEDTVEPYHSLFNGSTSLEQFQSFFSYRVDAVSDDSPYYFNLELGAPKILSDLLLFAALLAFGFVAAPLLYGYLRQRQTARQQSAFGKSLGLFIVYFSSLGVGYMLLEVALLQKFILFLGYPTRALAVILFSLLLSSGVGSLVSGYLVHGRRDSVRNILIACLLILAVVVIYLFVLPGLFSTLLPQTPLFRAVTSFLLLFPLGFLLGIPFPSGLRVLDADMNQNVSWMWGVNGAASVFGSIFATLGAIVYGFNYVLVFGMFAYFTALIVALLWQRK